MNNSLSLGKVKRDPHVICLALKSYPTIKRIPNFPISFSNCLFLIMTRYIAVIEVRIIVLDGDYSGLQIILSNFFM